MRWCELRLGCRHRPAGARGMVRLTPATTIIIIISCPEHLNRWPCHWLTDSLTFTFDIQRAILETCDLWDICSEWWEDMTWPKKLTKTNTKTKTMTKTKTFWEHLLRAILETCDIWDTDYNSDNWEPEFMTIFVTWQLIVTLDSIRNVCRMCNLVNWYQSKIPMS